MKRNFDSVIILLLLYFFMPGVNAKGKPSITWLKMDVPPYFILDGEFKGMGMIDQTTKLIQKELTDYEHANVEVSFNRAYALFDREEPYCHAAFFKNDERKEKVYFSEFPSSLSPPVGVTIKQSQYPYFNQQPLRLIDLLKNQSLIGGISSHRSYGEVIDSLIKEYENKANNLISRHSDKLYKGSYLMLLHDRLDYLVGYPHEAIYASKTVKPGNVITLPISESHNFLLGYVACSRNKTGKQVIESVNEVLEKIRSRNEYRHAFEYWMDQFSVEEFREKYAELILGN